MRNIAAALGMVAALSLATATAHADRWQRGFDVASRPKVAIHSDDGSIEITRGGTDRVDVDVVTLGWRIGEGHVRVTARQTGDTLTIEVRKPRRPVDISFTPRSIRTRVRVPAECSLDLHSGDGSISIDRVKGAIAARTGDGRIVATGLAGDLDLSTSDGRIEGTRLDGRLRASTGDGSIRIAGRFDALQVRTGDGRVTAKATAGSRLGAGWSLSTGDGTLSLAIPRDLAANLDAQTSDGRIRVKLPVKVEGRVRRSTLRGSLNGGGPPLKLRSGDGTIRLGIAG